MAPSKTVQIHDSWYEVLVDVFEQPFFQALRTFIREQYQTQTIYPPAKHIFEAFNLTPFDRVKVVIIGQDPYHGHGQAHGLCFSVNKGVPIPPSLQNIYKELNRDVGVPIPTHGCLTAWAEQGVLLLNSILTVQANKPASHKNIGWESFTDIVINILNNQKTHLVFMLWGKYAQEKGKYINENKHLVLKASHPSPLANPSTFTGCSHFSTANNYLKQNNIQPIDWYIP